MKPISNEDFEILLNHAAPLSISLFLPTHPSGPENRQAPTRFKNLVREAERHLVEAGLKASELPGKLAPLQRLLRERDFWQHLDKGLAVFLNKGALYTYRVPLEFKEFCVVGERFHLKPLLPLLTDSVRFFVLALSQDTVQLYEGTRYEITPRKLEDVPKNFEEATRFDDLERQVQLHTGASANPQGRQPTAIFHGQGVGTDDAQEKKRLLEYCHAVAHGVQKELNSGRAPLVLAAAEPLAGIYRMANMYPNLHDVVLHGHPDRVLPQDLHRQALEVVGPLFERERKTAIERYYRLEGLGRTGNDLETILTAASYGQVETLFVSVDDHVWGHFDALTHEITIHDVKQFGDHDLLDWAAVQTHCAGGTVFAVGREEIPDGAPIAATFRFARVAVSSL